MSEAEKHWDPLVALTALTATTEKGRCRWRYVNTERFHQFVYESVCVFVELCLVPLKAIVHPVNEVFESS